MFWHTATSSLLTATTTKIVAAAVAAVTVAGGVTYVATTGDSRDPGTAAVAPPGPANRIAQPPLEAPASDAPTSGPATEAAPTTPATTPPATAPTTTQAAPRAPATTKTTTTKKTTTKKANPQPPVPAQAPDTEDPSKPTGLTGTNLGNNQFDSHIILDWDPSTDNVGVVGYRIYTLTNMDGWQVVGDVHDGSTDDTITADEAWAREDFRVVAYDAAGNESEPAQIHVEVPFAV
jgi:hypothetical protein